MNKKLVRYLLLLFIIVLTPILVLATSNSESKETEYEKPTIDEIKGEEEFPEEKESSSSAYAKEREWYEYVTYSTKPVGEYTKNKTKYVYYDPYDYSYANIMEVSDVVSGDSIIFEMNDSFSTANEKEITYSKKLGFAIGGSFSFSSTTELEIASEVMAGASATVGNGLASATASSSVTGKVATKFSKSWGFTIDADVSFDTSIDITEKYNAVYFAIYNVI